MGRGPSIKTEAKRAKLVTKAKVKAAQEAIIKAKDKHFDELLKQKILEMIGNIDPLEIAAIGSLTLLIKPVIQKIPDLANYLTANVPFGGSLFIDSFREGEIVIFEIKNPFTGEILWKWSIPWEEGKPIDTEIAPKIPDLNAYLLAFAIALIIIKYPQVLTFASNGVVGLAKLIGGVGA